jgi:periplasmic divalent cation tolerance protein
LCVVWSTFPDRESAQRAAQSLVAERLVACAQLDVAAIESFYWWQGALAHENEFRLVLKTLRRLVPALHRRLRELHPYSVPQIVAVAADANDDYAEWLRGACRTDTA